MGSSIGHECETPQYATKIKYIVYCMLLGVLNFLMSTREKYILVDQVAGQLHKSDDLLLKWHQKKERKPTGLFWGLTLRAIFMLHHEVCLSHDHE